jgi:septum formation protein
MNLPIILASASPARLQLLSQVGIKPDFVIPADIDESEKARELPKHLAQRLSFEKASFIAATVEEAIIIGADTIPVVGRRIMRKAANADDVRTSLKLLSHRRHSVYTGVCIIKKTSTEMKVLTKVVKSIVKFKQLSDAEIEYFCSTDQGINKAGGYTLTGYAESFVTYLSGSFSNIIGLPLCETVNMLRSIGVCPFTPSLSY